MEGTEVKSVDYSQAEQSHLLLHAICVHQRPMTSRYVVL